MRLNKTKKKRAAAVVMWYRWHNVMSLPFHNDHDPDYAIYEKDHRIIQTENQ